MDIDFVGIPDGWDVMQTELQASFLQSVVWGEFQRSLGLRVGYMVGDGWSAMCIERRTAVGTYWFLPAGPTVGPGVDTQHVMRTIAEIASRYGIRWVRFELRGGGVSMAPAVAHVTAACINPSLTSIVSLEASEDEILRSMKSNHRSSIRRFARDGGEARATNTPADHETFIAFYTALGTRKQRVFRDADYLRAQFALPEPMRPLLYAAYAADGTMVSGCVVYCYGHTATYVYAASREDIRSFPGANHAMVWQAMKDAKTAGCDAFDLFGVSPAGDTAHDWYGLSCFKRDFGGEDRVSAPTCDMAVSKAYPVIAAAMSLKTAARTVKRRHVDMSWMRQLRHAM